MTNLIKICYILWRTGFEIVPNPLGSLLVSLFSSSWYDILCICGEFYKEYAGRDDKGFRQTVGGRMQRGASRCARGQSSMYAMHITFIGREIV